MLQSAAVLGRGFCLRLQVSSPAPLPPVRQKLKTSSSGAKGLKEKTIFKKEKQKRKSIRLDTEEKIKDNCIDLSAYMCMYMHFCIKIIYNLIQFSLLKLSHLKTPLKMKMVSHRKGKVICHTCDHKVEINKTAKQPNRIV